MLQLSFKINILTSVAVVLEYISLLVQVSSISYNIEGSILALHAWKSLTQQLLATGGRRWGDTKSCTVNWCKKVPSGVPD